MRRAISCGEAIVQSLVAHGTEVVFGIPGTHNLPIYQHLARCGLRHITPRHEQGAGFAADGYARVSGKPGVCLVTTGPGLMNITTAVATAYHDSIPLLIISPGMPADIEGRDTGYLHEMKAQSRAMDSLVSWSRRVASAQEAAEALRDAFAHFAAERPRPVHIEIPLDVLAEDETRGPLPVYRHAPPPAADPLQLDAARRVLESARRAGVIVGGGAVGARDEVRELAERLGAVVTTTYNGKGVLPEDHPLSLGPTLRFTKVQEALVSSDVVVAVGTELGEADTWAPYLRLNGELVRIDIDPNQLQKNVLSPAPLLGDAADVIRELLRDLPAAQADRVAGRERAESVRQAVQREAAPKSDPFRRLHEILAATLAPDAVIAGDSSQVSYFGTALLFAARQPRQFLYPGGFSPLGYGIAAAIGAKVAEPARQVVALVGDGAAMFSIAEVATAVELHLPLPIMIIGNGGYAQIRDAMLARGMAPIGVDLPAPDFALLGRGLGGEGMSLNGVDELGDALRVAFARDRPTIIELQISTRPSS